MNHSYFLKMGVCPHCGKGEVVIHIGNLVARDWFNVRGYSENDMPIDLKEMTREIASWSDWMKVLNYLTPKDRIENESGQRIPVREFITLVQESKNITERRSTLEVARDARMPLDPEYEFYDKEGFCVFMRVWE